MRRHAAARKGLRWAMPARHASAAAVAASTRGRAAAAATAPRPCVTRALRGLLPARARRRRRGARCRAARGADTRPRGGTRRRRDTCTLCWWQQRRASAAATSGHVLRLAPRRAGRERAVRRLRADLTPQGLALRYALQPCAGAARANPRGALRGRGSRATRAPDVNPLAKRSRAIGVPLRRTLLTSPLRRVGRSMTSAPSSSPC